MWFIVVLDQNLVGLTWSIWIILCKHFWFYRFYGLIKHITVFIIEHVHVVLVYFKASLSNFVFYLKYRVNGEYNIYMYMLVFNLYNFKYLYTVKPLLSFKVFLFLCRFCIIIFLFGYFCYFGARLLKCQVFLYFDSILLIMTRLSIILLLTFCKLLNPETFFH